MPEMMMSNLSQCAVTSGIAREQQAQQQNKARRLRADGEERGRGRGRALINIRRPHLKRKRRDLEAQPDQDEQHAEQEDFVVRERSGHLRQFGEIEFARDAPDQRDAINHERRRQRAEDQILHARLQRRDLARA